MTARLICHTVVQVALLAAYVYTGDEKLLTLMVGVIGGAGIQAIPEKKA